MQSWVMHILAPYFFAQFQHQNLPKSQRCVLQVDCWTVYRSDSFLGWMKETYPWIGIKFVPAICTGYFQARDISIQRVLKIAIRKAAQTDIVAETQKLRSVQWLVHEYRTIKNNGMVKKAFGLCTFPGASSNLSYESLNGRDARKALKDFFATDPKLYDEILLTSSLDSPFVDYQVDEPTFNKEYDSGDASSTAVEAAY
ncbi:ATP-binding cassette sub-family A member 6 [Ceratobasidium sp. AG-Ba]|nr:ATP-binding cassette sub-family A member 6 [Ceratobasidium sp. AG-Ba]QRV88109.1 ATP-binding cassette sub-family A member 6 [Ceratobasidium sp. AG-Ba]